MSTHQGWLTAASALLCRKLCRTAAREQDFLALLDHLDEGVLILDETGCILHANRAAQSIYPASETILTGAMFDELTGNAGAVTAINFGMQAALNGGSQIIEVRDKPQLDQPYSREISLTRCQYANKHVVIAVVRNFANFDRMGETSPEAAAFLEVTNDAVMITDLSGKITFVNPAFSAMTGYSAEEAIGQTHRLLSAGKQEDEFYAQVWGYLLKNGGWEGDVSNRRKSGETFIQHQTISAIRDQHGNPTKFISILNDISNKRSLENEIEHRANHDPLTGLANRNLLIERLDQSIKRGRRQKETTAVLFIDLDHFKRVNDKLGHSYGDKLLQEVSIRLQQCVRETDTVARQGGDEFVIVLHKVKDIDEAARVSEKVIAALSSPFSIDGTISTSVSASIGIAMFPDDGSNVNTLFRNADLAMYRAKSLGRNCYQFFEPEMTQNAIERRRLFDEMKAALAQNEFHLHYLPVFDLRTNSLVSAEALLRWEHPLRGTLEPGQFIALAEESGLIDEIDRWVFTKACSHLRRWCDLGLDLTMSVAVNLTGRKIPDTFSLTWLQAMLATHGLNTKQIHLEINEKLLLEEQLGSDRWVSDLRNQGFSIVLDDFGTGYSSLSRLKELPVNIIKIDRSLVAQITRDTRSENMVRAILSLAKAFDTKVIAEGVENDAQIALLNEMGCHLVQGYHLSRPLHADKFSKWAIGEQISKVL